jgi:hypothetical protein
VLGFSPGPGEDRVELPERFRVEGESDRAHSAVELPVPSETTPCHDMPRQVSFMGFFMIIAYYATL